MSSVAPKSFPPNYFAQFSPKDRNSKAHTITDTIRDTFVSYETHREMISLTMFWIYLVPITYGGIDIVIRFETPQAQSAMIIQLLTQKHSKLVIQNLNPTSFNARISRSAVTKGRIGPIGNHPITTFAPSRFLPLPSDPLASRSHVLPPVPSSNPLLLAPTPTQNIVFRPNSPLKRPLDGNDEDLGHDLPSKRARTPMVDTESDDVVIETAESISQQAFISHHEALLRLNERMLQSEERTAALEERSLQSEERTVALEERSLRLERPDAVSEERNLQIERRGVVQEERIFELERQKERAPRLEQRVDLHDSAIFAFQRQLEANANLMDEVLSNLEITDEERVGEGSTTDRGSVFSGLLSTLRPRPKGK